MKPGIPPLAGCRVAVTADRRAEEQVTLLERRGAETMVGAAVRTLPLVEDDDLVAAIEDVIARPPDFLVLLTGIGARSLVAAAEGMGRDGELIDALADTRVIARGPKAAGAAATIGLTVEWQTPGEQSVEILEHLREDAVGGARIAVQRDGQLTAPLADALRSLGADALDVPVYRWELPQDTKPVLRVIEAVADGSVDAVTFTSSPAVCHVVALAAEAGLGDALLGAFASGRVVAACVGPVCAQTAADVGIVDALQPRRARLGAMVQTIAAHFGDRGHVIVTRAGEIEVHGRSVFVGGELATIGTRERAVLDVLADARGAVVPKAKLLRDVWGADFDDEHAVEVAVGRLRRGLGPVGDALETVPRRGYRLS